MHLLLVGFELAHILNDRYSSSRAWKLNRRKFKTVSSWGSWIPVLLEIDHLLGVVYTDARIYDLSRSGTSSGPLWWTEVKSLTAFQDFSSRCRRVGYCQSAPTEWATAKNEVRSTKNEISPRNTAGKVSLPKRMSRGIGQLLLDFPFYYVLARLVAPHIREEGGVQITRTHRWRLVWRVHVRRGSGPRCSCGTVDFGPQHPPRFREVS